MRSIEARRFTASARLIPNPMGGGWHHSQVTIYDDGREIGGYDRNYGAFGDSTFEPFELGGRWYALYSPDYTCTRIMSLPDCLDIGGEEPNSAGFCPVELFVPRYRIQTVVDTSTNRKFETMRFESQADERPDVHPLEGTTFEFGPWASLDIGFVAGCVWGDDSTWKLEVFDLSQAAEGVLTRSDRFGHLELGKMPLAEAVDLYSDAPDWRLKARIVRLERRDVRSGVLIDPYDE